MLWDIAIKVLLENHNGTRGVGPSHLMVYYCVWGYDRTGTRYDCYASYWSISLKAMDDFPTVEALTKHIVTRVASWVKAVEDPTGRWRQLGIYRAAKCPDKPSREYILTHYQRDMNDSSGLWVCGNVPEDFNRA